MELFMPSFPKCSFPSFFKNYLLIYFWLCWVFIAAHGLSLVAECRGYSQVAVGGLLIAVAFPVVEHWLSYPTACGILPRAGIEHVSPALGGGFLTTWTTREVLLSFF